MEKTAGSRVQREGGKGNFPMPPRAEPDRFKMMSTWICLVKFPNFKWTQRILKVYNRVKRYYLQRNKKKNDVRFLIRNIGYERILEQCLWNSEWKHICTRNSMFGQTHDHEGKIQTVSEMFIPRVPYTKILLNNIIQ